MSVFGGYRRYFVAVVGIAFVSAAFFGAGWLINRTYHLEAIYRQNAGRAADYYTASAYVKSSTDCLKVVPNNAMDCMEDAHESAHASKRNEYDLEAQRVTAAWTATMGIAACIGMAFSILGVGLVWMTFAEQRRTNNISAQESESAKSETNSIAKSFLEAQRPRIFAIRLEEIPKKEIEFQITIANSGQNPAVIENINFSVFSHEKCVGGSGSRLFDKFIVPGSNERKVENPTIEIRHIHDWDSATTIRGAVDYSDVHGVRRRHGFSFVVCLGDQGENIITPEVRRGAWYDEEIKED